MGNRTRVPDMIAAPQSKARASRLAIVVESPVDQDVMLVEQFAGYQKLRRGFLRAWRHRK
jgi:hypothetical protein